MESVTAAWELIRMLAQTAVGKQQKQESLQGRYKKRRRTKEQQEKRVLPHEGMVRKMYSCTGIMGSKMISYQVIGATPDQCYGEGIPVKDGSPLSVDNEKSW